MSTIKPVTLDDLYAARHAVNEADRRASIGADNAKAQVDYDIAYHRYITLMTQYRNQPKEN